MELLCATLIALLMGLAICFGGYRLFLFLLPIWGFFFGFALGAETMQALFGVGFLATVTSWVVGFIVAAIFALLSYLFYAVGVALVAGSLGYALGAGFMNLINLDWNWLVWLVGNEPDLEIARMLAEATNGSFKRISENDIKLKW